MTIRLRESVLTPISGRGSSFFSGAVYLLNPYVVAPHTIALPLTPIHPIIISPLIVEATPVELPLNEGTTSYYLSFEATPASLPLNEGTVTLFYGSREFHTVSYGHQGLKTHYTSWNSESDADVAYHEVTWCLLGQRVHETSWASITPSTAQRWHEVAWASIGATTNSRLHEVSWASLGQGVVAQRLNEVSWRSLGLEGASILHEVSYQSWIPTRHHQFHTVTWASLGTSSAYHLHEVSWNSFEVSLAHRLHEVSYASLGGSTSARRFHEVSYASLGSTASTSMAFHQVTWQSIEDAQVSHEVFWKSIIAAHAFHQTSWETQYQRFKFHEVRYRSNQLNTIMANGAWTELDFIAVTISADEGSPYYQCEVTMKNADDYQRFPRDTAVVIPFFGVDYHFLVDTRSLNRTIDNEGNLQVSSQFTGLSPLVRYASPRATKITYTWDTPQWASAIVEGLIGSVTWNLVDWVIPAYRLAAENAAPLDIALQIVEAVGGFIESQPDGSVVCRHRWPVSLAIWETASVDATLSETEIFSATESPTNDELINRIRILDQDAGYQDRLEYLPNVLENGEDDPLNGVLYAFLSPWREEGLRLVTTRPSVIRLGTLSEGTRIIADGQEKYPAEILTFTERGSSTQYPVMSLTSFEWLDESLGSITVVPYSTTLEAGNGTYGGYSLAKVSYVTRYLRIPVYCLEQTENIEAQFLLLETQNG